MCCLTSHNLTPRVRWIHTVLCSASLQALQSAQVRSMRPCNTDRLCEQLGSLSTTPALPQLLIVHAALRFEAAVPPQTLLTTHGMIPKPIHVHHCSCSSFSVHQRTRHTPAHHRVHQPDQRTTASTNETIAPEGTVHHQPKESIYETIAPEGPPIRPKHQMEQSTINHRVHQTHTSTPQSPPTRPLHHRVHQ